MMGRRVCSPVTEIAFTGSVIVDQVEPGLLAIEAHYTVSAETLLPGSADNKVTVAVATKTGQGVGATAQMAEGDSRVVRISGHPQGVKCSTRPCRTELQHALAQQCYLRLAQDCLTSNANKMPLSLPLIQVPSLHGLATERVIIVDRARRLSTEKIS